MILIDGLNICPKNILLEPLWHPPANNDQRQITFISDNVPQLVAVVPVVIHALYLVTLMHII
jgi:hypothetical protein